MYTLADFLQMQLWYGKERTVLSYFNTKLVTSLIWISKTLTNLNDYVALLLDMRNVYAIPILKSCRNKTQDLMAYQTPNTPVLLT